MVTRRCNGKVNIEKKRQQGATLIEFALIAPMLFFLLFIIIELGVMFWVNLTMQYAVREGARYSITGQSGLDPATLNKQRYLAVIQRIKDSSMGLYTLVSPVIVINSVTKAPSDYDNSLFGASGATVVLQLDCTWPVVTPAWRLMALLNPTVQSNLPGQYAFSVAATMRNESFQ